MTHIFYETPHSRLRDAASPRYLHRNVTASLVVFCEHCVLYILMKAIWPAEVGHLLVLLLVRLEYK
jgi:hypothetical protein